MARTPLENIEIVAAALENLCSEVVFVGGATLELYLDKLLPKPRPSIRPTLDVDCIIWTSSKRADFYKWEERVQAIGFRNVPSGPICRFAYQGLVVDFMPTDGSILGFTNSWYPKGFQNAVSVALPSGGQIRILPLHYFLATKCEAFSHRGAKDLYASKDLEDIVFLLAFGKSVREEVRNAPVEIKEALDSVRRKIESKHTLLEIVEAHIDRTAKPETKQQVIDLLQIAQ